jgi:SPP1 family predicted phage head-tail adaptor
MDDNSVFADKVPAKIETLSGRELYTAQQKVPLVTHRVTIRWQRGILAKMNVGWFDERQKFFQIEAVENPDGRHIKLELLCIERADSSRNV